MDTLFEEIHGHIRVPHVPLLLGNPIQTTLPVVVGGGVGLSIVCVCAPHTSFVYTITLLYSSNALAVIVEAGELGIHKPVQAPIRRHELRERHPVWHTQKLVHILFG